MLALTLLCLPVFMGYSHVIHTHFDLPGLVCMEETCGPSDNRNLYISAHAAVCRNTGGNRDDKVNFTVIRPQHSSLLFPCQSHTLGKALASIYGRNRRADRKPVIMQIVKRTQAFPSLCVDTFMPPLLHPLLLFSELYTAVSYIFIVAVWASWFKKKKKRKKNIKMPPIVLNKYII